MEININNKKEFYLRSVISKAKKGKLSFKTAYNKTQLEVDWNPLSYKDIEDMSFEYNKINFFYKIWNL